MSNDKILDERLIDIVNERNNVHIDDYIEDITIRQFIESILYTRPIIVAKYTVLLIILKTVHDIINGIVPNPYTVDDLINAYNYKL